MVEKSTIIQDVFKEFYNRLKDDVDTVTLNDDSERTIQNYTSSYPDIQNSSKSDYPILIVGSPDISWTNHTLGKKQAEGTIDIEIITTKKEAGDLFADKICNSIETYRGEFRDEGLKNIQLSSSDYDFFDRGKIKLHNKSLTFEWEFIFNKTKAY
ncbi:MAG: hypothetical protein ACOC80_16650 [Petrotogales bacterium]